MAAYDFSSTKAYMKAMEGLMELLLELPDSLSKAPHIDNEPTKVSSLGPILERFSGLDARVLDSISENGAESRRVLEIERLCERISVARDQAPSETLLVVKGIVSDQKPDEELQSALFDVLGFEEFDLISLIVQNKAALLEKTPETAEPGSFLTAEQRVQQLIETQERTKNQPLAAARASQTYPHVFKKPDVGSIVSITGKKFALPQGTTRDSYPTHEEIVIPYPENQTNKWISDSKLVKVAQLDFLCQGTFKNYSTLNKMQSLVFPVAYSTNENMLVCAPTGAGKTDVALLTILHCIHQYVTETVGEEGDVTVDIDYDEFKIVYIAPLKALAAEIVDKYAKKLQWLGITVRELTGDMQLSKSEIMATQIIVTTPEKWDVVTRKLGGDNELVSKVKLLIIDEVHLLHEERGSVIETLVARTLRQVESTQLMIRVVGLSATLPNYMDVADFLGVNRHIGMFYFDQSFRPCPLKQKLIGVRGKAGSKTARENIDKVAYDNLVDNVSQGLQVMVFVHSRKDTVKTARTFILMAQLHNELGIFDASSDSSSYDLYKREMAAKNRNKDMKELFASGFGCHHAGMLRLDRNLTEKLFLSGAIKVLCCTATLAWGVNLPAAVVIVKGTQVYDSKQGGFVDLGILDVIQIFGRAGRPQFESFGTGILCTLSDRLDHYVSLITQQHPIELRLGDKIVDNLNAEISLGTVTNVDEAVAWLGYTYMIVRMRQNPFAYGIDWKELQNDPALAAKRHSMVVAAARRLHQLQMVVFAEATGLFVPKDLGRIASDFYLLNNSVEVFSQMLNPRATEADVLAMLSMSSEFDSIKFREEEAKELKALLDDEIPCQVGGDVELAPGKTNILLQAYICQSQLKDLALILDCNYVAQNLARICRALFLIGINRRWGAFSRVLLALCKAIDRRLWAFEHPLAQFELPEAVMRNIRAKNPLVDALRSMDAGELGDLVHNSRMGGVILKLVDRIPLLEVSLEIFPITSNVMRIVVQLEPDFTWEERYHGQAQFFWVTVEELENTDILHVEKFILNRRLMATVHEMTFMVPLADPLPAQIVVRVVSDSWMGLESVHPISFQHLIRPQNETIRTSLLRLQPLPIRALHDKEVEKLYEPRFRYFNPMQTMAFHTLYNTQNSVFVGSPTGLGKTVVAELAMWSAFRASPGSKVVYIAPMKALVRERVDDWRRITQNTSHRLVEMTGDSLPEAREVREADIIITTPEKFDGILRSWQTRKFVQQVSLVVMDEIHLLASDRGPILEMIVSRMNYVSQQTKHPVRLLGMSTAVSNAADMAGWLGVKEGLFNFPSSVRPVPLQMYIDGFPDNLAFSPLMKTMNKPAFMAIKQHSPTKPVLVFVASRRQTRLTALDLIHMCGAEANPRRFLRMEDSELEAVLPKVKDETLRLALQFGMGLHHAGLVELDRKISHRLFEAGKIQILIATSTLAWGVNLPAHLVIIKGTQFFDAKTQAYRDMDLTDILQMMGRAGRPAFDTSGTAIVYTKESKKVFYKHFLNVGFPVESSLHKVLDDHLGAEIASGAIATRQQALDFLAWTFLFRRAHNNPTYYGIEDTSSAGVSLYLAGLVDGAIAALEESQCVVSTGKQLFATPFLHILSYYYLSHRTMRNLAANMARDSSFRDCLRLLCQAAEYDELATRHGEELINMEMLRALKYPAEDMGCEYVWDPHVKAYLLVQAFLSRVELPIVDYTQDTVAVLDQALRILQAYIDAAAEKGFLGAVLKFVGLMQCLKQRVWDDDMPLSCLPGVMPFKKGLGPKGGSLEAIGTMTTGQLHGLASLLGVSAENDVFDDKRRLEARTDEEVRRDFVRVASHVPTGVLSVSQKEPAALSVELVHDNAPLNADFRMHCPHYPKAQRELWFVVVCDRLEDELLLLKRASPRLFGKKGKVACVLEVPEELRERRVDVLVVNDAMKIEYEQQCVLL